MEFFEFVLIFSMLFVLPITIMKTIFDYKKAKGRAEVSEGEASGVTAGELRRLLREAVEEANAPLLDRIDELEARMLSAPRDEEDYDAAPQERTLGRRLSE